MLRLLSLACMTAMGSLTASPLAVPSLDQLLDNYEATVDRCLASFAVKGEMVMDTRWKRAPTPALKPGRHTLFVERDFRYDGRRTRSISHKWGDLGRRERIPKEDPIINSNIIDTDFRATYSGQQDKPGLIKYRKEPLSAELVQRRLDSQWVGASAFGFFASKERIDTILRRCDNATVREQTEQINGSDCYVIDADTEQGKFTVWIDPQHGHHIAKIHATQEKGDRVRGRLFREGDKVVSILSNVAFRQIDGVWIVTESMYDTSVVHLPHTVMTGRTHSRITEFLIEPDHEALHSFEIDDFPEGQRVAYFENGQLLPVWFVWRGGRPVPDVNDEVVDELDRIADELLADTEPGAESSQAAVGRTLNAYVAIQTRLRSFISEEETTVHGRTAVEVCDFRSDGDRTRHQRALAGTLESSAKGTYESFLWDGTYLIQYETSAEPSAKGTVRMSRDPNDTVHLITGQYKGAPLMGFLAGDTERVDTVIRSAKTSSVRRVDIRGRGPYELIEAETARGTYKVWFDPQHGYHIARAEVQRKPTGASRSEYLAMVTYNVKFEQIDGLWVPMEASVRSCAGVGAAPVSYHLKRKTFTLNPDHEGLGSFLATEIPEGTPVTLEIDAHTTTRGVWKDGRPLWEEQ